MHSISWFRTLPSEEESAMTITTAQTDLSINQTVHYPAHGVGKISDIGNISVSGVTLEVYEVFFPRERGTVKVPTHKAKSLGLIPVKKIACEIAIAKSLRVIVDTKKTSRKNWSQRVVDISANINSGSLQKLAEAIRDLNSSPDGKELSYSERELLLESGNRLIDIISAVTGKEEGVIRNTVDAQLKKHNRLPLPL